MAKKTSNSKSTTRTESIREKITHSYIDYILSEGKQPPSVYAFTKKLGIEEVDFYGQFTSFDAIDQDIWLGFFTETAAVLQSDKQFAAYSVREKLLSLYYTWLETLLPKRSYVTYYVNHFANTPKTPSGFKLFKEELLKLAQSLVSEAIENKELLDRPYISDRYDRAIWLETLFILKFWVNDSSTGFEQSDAAIEKSVNLLFELLGKSTLDQVIDFGKFLWQANK